MTWFMDISNPMIWFVALGTVDFSSEKHPILKTLLDESFEMTLILASGRDVCWLLSEDLELIPHTYFYILLGTRVPFVSVARLSNCKDARLSNGIYVCGDSSGVYLCTVLQLRGNPAESWEMCSVCVFLFSLVRGQGNVIVSSVFLLCLQAGAVELLVHQLNNGTDSSKQTATQCLQNLAYSNIYQRYIAQVRTLSWCAHVGCILNPRWRGKGEQGTFLEKNGGVCRLRE